MQERSTRDGHRERRSLSPRERILNNNEDRHRDRSSHAHHRHREATDTTRALPFKQRKLGKHDLKPYTALFADYLDVQKGLTLGELAESEIKGRWKSFTGKWNRGELAEGWYDPAVLQRSIERSKTQPVSTVVRRPHDKPMPANGDASDDDLGPHLPGSASQYGPAIPSLQDLQYRREGEQDDQAGRQQQHHQDRRMQRKTDKERLNELAPRAEPGSKERQLEKKRDLAQSNKTFAADRESGVAEVADTDLLGDDGVDAYKAKMKAQQRQKNEREIRKEEVLRARAAEREERLAEHRRKEEKTMQTLRALAEQRYGSS